MGSLETLEKIFIRSVIPFGSPGNPSVKEEAGIGHDGRTPRPCCLSLRCLVQKQMRSSVHLSCSKGTLQLWNPLPPINKIPPPPMKHRDSQPNLMTSMSHLRGNQPDGPPNPLDMLLPIKRRQH